MKRALSRTVITLVMANSIFGLAGCGGSEEGAAVAGAPAPGPAPVPPPAPPPLPPPTYSATVSWLVPLFNTDGTPLTDVTGYRVHYGTSPTDLTQLVLVSGVGVTSRVISGLAPGTYYFAVATLNSAGAESDLSNPASRTVP